MKRYLLALLLGGSVASAPLSAAPVELLSFQAAGVAAFQNNGNAYSGQLGWSPFFEIGPVSLRGEIGVTALKNVLSDLFLVFNYEVLARLTVLPSLTVEGGGGCRLGPLGTAARN